MTECTYCGKDCESAEDLTVHLAEEHTREELSRIDRTRVDRYEEDGAGGWRQFVSTDGTAGRYTRRGILGAIAAGGLAGSGIAAGELTGSDVPSLGNLVGNQEEKGEKDSEGEVGPSSPQPASTPTVQNAGSGALLDVTFTNAGATGRKGPSQSEVDSEYSGTDLDGDVTVVGDGIQEWNVPADGTYRITAYGAGGGGSGGGLGVKVAGNFKLQEGNTLQILVGQTGVDFASGGGGSFVAKGSSFSGASPLLVAGGGAGEGNLEDKGDGPRPFMNATVPGPGETASDGQPNDCGTGSGGSMGEGGTTPDDKQVAGAGGGFNTNGDDGGDPNSGGDAFQNGGVGGVATNNSADGGFGGGGGGFGPDDESGGGGGYNGGAGGDTDGCGLLNSMGGGGGSYNAGGSPTNEAEVNVGHGLVRIQRFTAISIEGDNVTFSNTTIETGD